MRFFFKLLTPPAERAWWFRGLVLILTVALALLARHYLDPLLGDRAPYALLTPAVLVAAWFGGWQIGLLATIAGGLVAAHLFAPGGEMFWPQQAGDAIAAAVFAAQGLMVSVLCGLLHAVFGQWRAARRQATQEFENLANHAPGFVWSTKADGSPGFVNQTWLSFTGLGAWGAGADRLAPLHPADIQRVHAVIAEARETGSSYNIEYRLRRHDGQYRWVLEHGLPQFTTEGELEGMIGSGTDITTAHLEREELVFTAELQRALSSTLDIDETARGVVHAVVPVLADWCVIYLLSDDGSGPLQRLATASDGHDLNDPEAEPLNALLDAAADRLLTDGAPRLVGTLDEEFYGEVFAAAPLAVTAPVPSSYAGVPLRVHGKAIGLLALGTFGSHRVLGEDDLGLARRIAGSAGFALENARLYRSVRQALAAEAEARVERERSEQQFRAAWEADIFAICILQRSGKVSAGNPAFLRLFGCTAGDLAAGNIDLHSRLGEREAQFGTFTWEHISADGPCVPFEKVCLRPDGKRVPVLVGGSLLPDQESCIIFLVDLSARKAAEAALEHQRALLKTIIDAVPAMIGYLDPEGRIQQHNLDAERWFARPGEELSGRTLAEVFGAEAYAEIAPQFASALAGREAHHELRIQTSQQTRHVMLSYRPDLGPDGRCVGVVLHAYDVTESRLLALAIARSEKRYRTLIAASAAIVWMADGAGRLISAEGWEQFTGEDPHLGTTRAWDRVHPEDRPRVEAEWRRIATSLDQWQADYRLLARDGFYHHVHARASAIADEAGSVVEWVGTIADVHARVEAEHSLRRKEAELELVVDTVPALVSYIDRELRFGLANRTHEQWFGLEPAVIRGRRIWDVYGETVYGEMKDKITRVLAGETVRYEAEITFRATPVRWINAVLTPHKAEDGRVLGFFSLALDITERKATENQLAEALDRYRFLADAMPQNVWTADAAGRQDYVNQRWVEYTGVAADAAVRPLLTDLVHPDDAAATHSQWESARADGRRFEIEHRLRDASGRYHWFLSRALARRDGHGQIIQWVGTATNIDAQRRAYAELAEARSELKRHAQNLEQEIRLRTARLEEVNGELEAFTYSASHDLRVPIHHIHEFAKAIVEDDGSTLSAASEANLRLIVGATERMDTLIVDLLAYSRLSHSELVVRPTQLEPVINTVLASHRTTINRLQATVRVETPLLPVSADRVGVTQALSNLVGNALKFAKPGRPPEIVVRTTEHNGRPRLWIEDNGIGIASHQHQAIFRLFHRLHGAQQYPGTGIGLSLVAKAMTRMGGSCGVESTPGVGSRFWLEFQPVPTAVAQSGFLPQSAA